VQTLLQDIRGGIRFLWKNPGFTIVAILTLALGIGANTSLFSVVNGVLLNPLPYAQPDRITAIYTKTPTFARSSISYLNFLDWQKDNRAFESIAAYRGDDFNLTGMGDAERLRGDMISATFFPLLGVKPVIGRPFTQDEDRVGGAPVVLVSEGFWKRKFGSSQEILGKSINLNGKVRNIIGVIPSSFHLGRSNDVYVPIGQWDDSTFRDRRVSMGSHALGRLKPGFTIEQARSDMDGVARNLEAAYPEADAKSGVSVISLKESLVGDIQPFLLVLLAAVGFVLLIACANVANLLLARATGRTREFAIRLALGASRGRVVRQLLTESVLLGIIGGGLGLLLAAWGTQAILGVLPDALPRSREIGIDLRVLLFTFSISVLAGVVFGLVPAFKMLQPDLQETLKEGGRGSSTKRHRAQSVFVVAEVALALVLLVGAGLMIRSLSKLWSVNPGFNPHNVLTFSVALPPAVVAIPGGIRPALRAIQDGAMAIPGVEAVSIEGGGLPMTGDDSELPFWHEGQPAPANDADMNWALFYLVETDHLKAMGIPLIRGRFISPQDDINTPPVMVIDESFARKYFPNEDPIGKRLNLGILGTQAEIVGIAGHVKHWGLDDDATSPLQAQMYIPFMQIPDKFLPLVASGVNVVLRSQGDPLFLVSEIRAAMNKINSQQVMYGTQTMDEVISDSLAARRFSMTLLGLFAALALVLSSIGIYGVISYLVGQRTQEIGIRIALGAQRTDVLRLVVSEGAKMAAIGVTIGLVAAFALTRQMDKMLFGVSATDPLTFAGVAVVLLAVALLACYIPARRAMRVDPMVALRYE
jgi:predicted permease